ncbi:MAG: hypothetical protein OES57_18290 [Acidimicrobiia bacterium]|nr:hypothetical protein [Acidimicrobiia bacterium]
MLGPGSNRPPRDEKVLAAALVALYPFALHGRSATTEEVENWEELRQRYLGLQRCCAPTVVTD